MLELNEVVLKGERQTLSLMAYKGRLTCLTGGTAERRRRWLYAMMGFEPAQVGVVCVDGEPLTDATAAEIRALMGFVPHELKDEGEVRHYEAPSVQDVFRLRANRHLPISNGILAEEMRRTGVTDDQARVFIVKAAEYGAIPSCDILSVFGEYLEPRHAEFRERSRWSLLNAFTEIAHKYKPARFDACNRRLTRLFALDGRPAVP
jgi:hypothetical protein